MPDRSLRPFICAALLVLSSLTVSSAQSRKEPVDYVNPNIGGIGHLLTATEPVVLRPHGMVQLAPGTTPGVKDRYLADRVFGFPAAPPFKMYGSPPVTSRLMATAGPLETDPARQASLYDHSDEVATPYYYAATLQASDVRVEYSATDHASYYRFVFPAGDSSRLLIAQQNRSALERVDANTIRGYDDTSGVRTWFYAEFSRPSDSFDSWQGGNRSRQPAVSGSDIGIAFNYRTRQGEAIEVRIGVSYISQEQALLNLRKEIPEWGFERVKQEGRDAWNRALSRIEIEGGSESQRIIFYSALYRSMTHMIDITEDGRYFSGFDRKVHQAGGHRFYTGDGTWDTYRSLHPLQLLIEPERQLDMLRSYVLMYEQSGWLPSFPFIDQDFPAMIGHHATAFITDAWFKGYRDFDVEKAYEGMRKNALEATMIPDQNGPATPLDRFYFEHGWFPALERGEKETEPKVRADVFKRQAVSVTLEHCYDDWCLAQMAKALGKTADYELFAKRSANYRNVFDPRIGFMAPKTAAGNWIEGFDPKLSGGQGGRDYFTECNSWIYTFHVQHDIPGLIGLMGGRERFVERLDALFEEQYGESKYNFLKQFPDMTGLIGNYAQGNEPSFHIPFLYNYAGEPWKTQRRVREIMEVWYNPGPLGLCGDDDLGALSSWYVFNAMGFYPVCPGRPVYDLGSPIFRRITLHLEGGRTFVIEAANASESGKYIQRAELNGKPLDGPWIKHSSIVGGGRLVLDMGKRPNLKWGASVQSR